MFGGLEAWKLRFCVSCGSRAGPETAPWLASKRFGSARMGFQKFEDAPKTAPDEFRGI